MFGKFTSLFAKTPKIDHKAEIKKKFNPAFSSSRLATGKDSVRESMKHRFSSGLQTTTNAGFAKGAPTSGPSFAGKLSNKNFAKTSSSSVRPGVSVPKLPPGVGRGL